MKYPQKGSGKAYQDLGVVLLRKWESSLFLWCLTISKRTKESTPLMWYYLGIVVYKKQDVGTIDR